MNMYLLLDNAKRAVEHNENDKAKEYIDQALKQLYKVIDANIMLSDAIEGKE